MESIQESQPRGNGGYRGHPARWARLGKGRRQVEARDLSNGGQGPASYARVWETPWLQRDCHALSLGGPQSS